MTPSGPDDPERRLRALRERQAELAAAGQGDSAAMRALAREIAALAGGLGFDPEESAAIADQIEAGTIPELDGVSASTTVSAAARRERWN